MAAQPRTIEARRNRARGQQIGRHVAAVAAGTKLPGTPLLLPVPEADPEDEDALARADEAAPDIGEPVSWQEYAAKVRAGVNVQNLAIRRIERETLERQRIRVDEVRAWCDSQMAIVRRAIERLGNMPTPTPEQAEWLARWDRQTRDEIQAGAL